MGVSGQVEQENQGLTKGILPENQISANYRYIENNQGSGKVVISKESE
jgi:hypothetical protein